MQQITPKQKQISTRIQDSPEGYNNKSSDTAAQKQVICAVYVHNSIHQPISNKHGTCLTYELPHLG